MKSKMWMTVAAGCLCASGVAYASQTVNYTYDALGRLVQSQIQSGPGSGTVQAFQYDNAGNRKQYTVTGVTGQTAITLSMPSSIVNVMTAAAGATLTVNVSSPSATGTVTFSENGVFLGSAWVTNGQASVVIEGLAMGVHTIAATYSGDGTYATQTTTFTVRVQNLSWLPAVLNLLLQ